MDTFELLQEQHRHVEDLLDALEGVDAEGSGDLVARLQGALSLHHRLEALHLHPLVLRLEGRLRARQDEEDHLTLHELAQELEEQTPGSADWLARLVALRDVLVAHVHDEESAVLGAVEQSLTPLERDDVARSLERSLAELRRRAAEDGPEPPLVSDEALLDPAALGPDWRV